MKQDERIAKEHFREVLQMGFRHSLRTLGFSNPENILKLECFGSFASGFGTAGSDVDIALVLSKNDPSLSAEQIAELETSLPRLLEKTMLDAGIGARLLTRTRVPILKVCEAPLPELLSALREEREKWDDLPEDQKHSSNTNKDQANDDENILSPKDAESKDGEALKSPLALSMEAVPDTDEAATVAGTTSTDSFTTAPPSTTSLESPRGEPKHKTPNKQRPWLREKTRGPLDFPKSGVGVQADINFSNQLAQWNTHMLHCYSLCDPRVTPMVLFVKSWAKQRRINSSYSGTLSSYGYVLMVLHFLVNIARPPVLPNLQTTQQLKLTDPSESSQGDLWLRLYRGLDIEGYTVKFWGDEQAINEAAREGRLTQNQDPLGVLLRHFFQYYAQPGAPGVGSGFNWTQEVLSLRTPGGLLDKGSKGWTGAKTTVTENVSKARPPYKRSLLKPCREKSGTATSLPSRILLSLTITLPVQSLITASLLFEMNSAEHGVSLLLSDKADHPKDNCLMELTNNQKKQKRHLSRSLAPLHQYPAA